MSALRDYQLRAISRCESLFTAGTRRVCLVSPTGSGKTTMGAAIVAGTLGRSERCVWIAHRRELVAQTAARLRAEGRRVGMICPGLEPDDAAPVQVATIQTALARNVRPEADLVVLDEFHHYAPAAERFAEFGAAYSTAHQLGLTATPERRDGSPLGDVCDGLVVAASYSELIGAGHIVPCDVYAPPPAHNRNGWAIDPLSAYTQYAAATRCFAFFDRVARAEQWSAKFVAAGIAAAVVSDATRTDDRARFLDRFAAGDLRVICNVQTMTEGIDVPAAATCLLARPFSHPSGYLQAVGRVLRPSPGKERALLLDLVGASRQHGSPTEDRIYSLDGEPMRAASQSAGRMCPQCGFYPMPYCAPSCQRCGWILPIVPPPTIKIWNVGLRKVYAGADTAAPYKRAERDRLVALCRARGWSLSWAIKEYRKLFAAEPDFSDLDEATRREEYGHLTTMARERGYKPGFVAVRFRMLFGCWPSPSNGAKRP